MTSIEKVRGLLRRLYGLQPEDESTAQMLQLLVALSPALVKYLPSDPAELDRYLRTVAFMALQCRSDEAPRLGLYELVEGKPGDPPEWVPVGEGE